MRSKLKPDCVDVLILCGGKGERLREVVNDRPKPLAEIKGRPFLDLIIDFTSRFGFRRFVLLAGYMGDLIKEYAIKKTQTSSLEIDCLIEPTALGTGGAVKNAEELIKSTSFLLLNGDSICPSDLRLFLMYHNKKGALATIMLSQAKEVQDYGNVVVDGKGRIISFQEKTGGTPGALVNAGVYLMKKEILDILPSGGVCSLEKDIFPKIVDKDLFGYVVKESHLDIGTPERYLKAHDSVVSLIK